MPCPLCGGLIHPIAGKCKHCKADLASYHAARAPASAPLPSLRTVAPTPNAGVHWNPGRSEAPPPARPDSPAVEPEPRGGWRSWPVIVIALAMVAIVAAVVLMVWPASHASGEKHVGAPPAPERMDTAPEVTAPPAPSAPHASAAPPAAPDPWATPNPPPPAANPTPAPPDDDPADNANPLDAFADTPPGGKPSAGRPGLNTGASMVLSMAVHVCRKIQQCSTSVDVPAATIAMCDALRKQPILPPRCPAAHRCLNAIDAMTCDATDLDPRQAGMLLNQFVDCSDATQCT